MLAEFETNLKWSKFETVLTRSSVFLCVFVSAAVKQLKETVSSSIHKLANFEGKN